MISLLIVAGLLAACGGETSQDGSGGMVNTGGLVNTAEEANTGGIVNTGGEANTGVAPPPPGGCRGPGLYLCDGECVNLLMDSLNCGACGNVCSPGVMAATPPSDATSPASRLLS